MEKDIAVMRKTIIVLTLLVGILIGALIGNPMKKSEAYLAYSTYDFDPDTGYCFAERRDSNSIAYLGKAQSEDDCRNGKARMVMNLDDQTRKTLTQFRELQDKLTSAKNEAVKFFEIVQEESKKINK